MTGVSDDAPPRVHVLVVDDDVMVRGIAVRLLQSMGYLTTDLEGGAEVIDTVVRAKESGRPVDVVLVDLQLEGESGLDVCKRLRAERSEVAVVCMTADSIGHAEAESLLEAGFDGLLEKPFSFRDLGACIDRHAKTRRA
jgi:CheY-like chemotaxis protein